MSVRFSKANTKIQALSVVDGIKPFLTNKRKVYSFDLLSGYSCPFAKECLSKATTNADGKRKIKDGPHTQFRCFSASQEVQYNGVYNLRKANFDQLRQLDTVDMVKEISSALPKNVGVVRIHVAGDLFNEKYLKAWIAIANLNPNVLFYAYTKSLRYWVANRETIDNTPNLVMTASRGGSEDRLIEEHGLRSTTVVFSEEQAHELGLPIDHDDSYAADPSLQNTDFALLIHGTQPKGSDAAKGLKELKGKGSYNKEKLNKKLEIANSLNILN